MRYTSYIRRQIENGPGGLESTPNSISHLKANMEGDSIGFKLTFGLADIITANPFEGVPDEAQDIWDKGDYNTLINEIVKWTLGLGHCVVEIDEKDPSIWMVYKGEEILIPIYDAETMRPAYVQCLRVVFNASRYRIIHLMGQKDELDKNMWPTMSDGGWVTAEVAQQNSQYGATYTFKQCKGWWIEYNFTKDHYGLSILTPVWDPINYHRGIIDNMSQFDAKLGSGFGKMTVDHNIWSSDEERRKLEHQMGHYDSQSGAVLPVGADFDIIGSKAVEHFSDDVKILREECACALNMPTKFFDGESGGAVFGSGESTQEDGKIIRTRVHIVWEKLRTQIINMFQTRFPEWDWSELDANVFIELDEMEAQNLNEGGMAPKGPVDPTLPPHPNQLTSPDKKSVFQRIKSKLSRSQK